VVRHNRADAFDQAWHRPVPANRWTDLADDPNDPAAIADRARTLQAAWRDPIADRIVFLEQHCRGRNVLDIGCVAHDIERLAGPEWLHGRIAAAAATCVGVDILEAGVDAVNAAGYDAVAHDLSTGLGPLAERGPFDVIVAGELLEHVPDLDMVFRVAAEGLADDGELILTTPNPYAPQRVRAGQLGIVWENVDHIMYAFPSGIAELAARRGLVLTEAATADEAPPVPPSLIRRVKRTIRGSHWRNVGYASAGTGSQVLVGGTILGRARRRLTRTPRRFLGETFVYVITRPDPDRSRGHVTGAA
jgi:2-polyprenyl-3-methyl-5-hydroxy-6-metoxy-1,4-benzoquinol methylase